jgi:hypothetical protein
MPAAMAGPAIEPHGRSHIMPQDNPRHEIHRSEQIRSESARAERARAERPVNADILNAPIGKIGTQSVKTGLRMQHEMFEVLHDIGREWFARASSEAELAFNLPNKLSAARSVPDALSAYQEWFNEWVSMVDQNGRRFIADSQRIIGAGTRCFANATPPPR